VVDHDFYYRAIDKMEKVSVDAEFIQGWIGGYMGNPKREEQRLTEAYQAGFAAGEQGDADAYAEWVKAG